MLMKYFICAISLCNTFSVVCMQMQKECPRLPFIEPNPYAMQTEKQPPYIITTSATNNHILTAMEPGWEKLNEIGNERYTSNAIPLEPMYYSPQVQSQKKYEQEHKPLLRVNPFGPSDDEHMQRVCAKVSTLIASDNLHKKYTQEFTRMIHDCIDDCKAVKKQYGINEDHLGAYAHKQELCKTALFFSSLKRYNGAIAVDDEKKPRHFGELSDLAKALGLTCDMIEKPLPMTMAMKLLVDDICNIEDVKDYSLKELVTLLYSGKKLEQKNYESIVVEPEWKKSFVSDAFTFACCYVNWNGTIRFSGGPFDSIIEKVHDAQKNGSLTNERDLGFFALRYEPIIWQDGFDMKLSYATHKNSISLLAFLITRYNNARVSKITPTHNHLESYLLAKKLHCAWPTAFDARLLDSQHVAFEEKLELRKNIGLIFTYPNHYVEQYVAALYSPESEGYSAL